MKVFSLLLFSLLVSCKAAPTDNSSLNSQIVSNTSTNSNVNMTVPPVGGGSDPTFDNLSSKLRDKYIDRVVSILGDLSAKFGEEDCIFGEAPILKNEKITEQEIQRVFNSIDNKLTVCLKSGKLPEAELLRIQKELNELFTGQQIATCKTNSDCRLSSFSVNLNHCIGKYAQSRFVHGNEGMVIGTYIQTLNSRLSLPNNLELDGDPNPVCSIANWDNTQLSCSKNVCEVNFLTTY